MRNGIINRFGIKIFVLLVLLLCLGSGYAFSSIYYVANTGSDSNAGNEASIYLQKLE